MRAHGAPPYLKKPILLRMDATGDAVGVTIEQDHRPPPIVVRPEGRDEGLLALHAPPHAAAEFHDPEAAVLHASSSAMHLERWSVISMIQIERCLGDAGQGTEVPPHVHRLG